MKGRCPKPGSGLFFTCSILPRQGQVAPKVTEGEGHATAVIPYLPLRLASAIHLPLAGEDRKRHPPFALSEVEGHAPSPNVSPPHLAPKFPIAPHPKPPLLTPPRGSAYPRLRGRQEPSTR